MGHTRDRPPGRHSLPFLWFCYPGGWPRIIIFRPLAYTPYRWMARHTRKRCFTRGLTGIFMAPMTQNPHRSNDSGKSPRVSVAPVARKPILLGVGKCIPRWSGRTGTAQFQRFPCPRAHMGLLGRWSGHRKRCFRGSETALSIFSGVQKRIPQELYKVETA